MMKLTLAWIVLLGSGWLAEALASHDAHIDAGIAAYAAGDYEEALARYVEAEASKGERSEIAYNRGLVQVATDETADATQSFQRASEADDADTRASAHFALGNLAYASEQWDGAVSSYVACLRARADHHNAKWNLELALQRKQEDEEKDEEEEKEEGDDEEDKEKEEDEEKDEEADENEQDKDEDEDENEDENEGEEGEKTEDEKDENQGEEKDEKKDEETNEDEKEDEQQDGSPREEEQGEQGDEKPEAAPAAIDELDIDKALEQLDNEDNFLLGGPRGGPVKVEKDW
ncbi:MAG: hypothetical protein V3V08_01470 [Nannocystaceae bacterium]